MWNLPSTAVGSPDTPRLAYRLTDTYGLVLGLIVVDYIVVSTLTTSGWGRVVAVFCLGTTLWYILRVSRSRLLWQRLALIYVLISMLSALVSELAPGADVVTQHVTVLAGILLLVTPFAILRHIASHRVITTETLLGAASVYLLLGFSFAFLFLGIATLSPAPFFQGQSPATVNNALFFSYTTLTTVGYGNLVPAGSMGQTSAMLEALLGQIYLVVIIARLVSLWGQERQQVPTGTFRQRLDATPPEEGRVAGDAG